MNALRFLYLAFLLVGVSYLVAGSEHDLGSLEMPGDGVFPILVGTVFTILSLIAVIQSLRSRKNSARRAGVFPRGTDLRRVLWITISLVLFAVLFRTLGFYICIFALMAAMLSILGPWSWFKICWVSLVMVVLSYLLFQQLLGVPLPKGSLWV